MPTKHQLATLEDQLVQSGWPQRGSRPEDQHLVPIVDPARVKAFAPEEDGIVLLPPPFETVAADAARNPDYWHDSGALDQLNPDEAVLIADFGIGSDASVVIDFRSDPARVLHLVWDSAGNRWDEIAASVEDFLRFLSLTRRD